MCTGTVRNLREEFCSTNSGPLRHVRVVFSQNTIKHDCEKLCTPDIQVQVKLTIKTPEQNRVLRQDAEQHSVLKYQASLNLDVSQGSQLGEETSAYNVLEYS